MLSSNMILVTALFLLLSSSTVMSATPTREGAQKEGNYDECDVLRKLIKNASGAKQLVNNYHKIQSLFFADGLVDIKAKFRLTSDKVDEEVIIPKKVTEDTKFIYLVYMLINHSLLYKVTCIDNSCYTTEKMVNMLELCPLVPAESYFYKILSLEKFKFPALFRLANKSIAANFQGYSCMWAQYFNFIPSEDLCTEKISVFDFLSLSRIYYDQFSNVTIEMEFDLCEKFGSSKCYQFRLTLPSDTSEASYWITRWRKPAILTLIDPVNGMKIDFLKYVNGKKKNDEL